MYTLDKIDIEDVHPLCWGLPLDKTQLGEGLRIMAKFLGKYFPEMARVITLYLVDDRLIARANQVYMQCPGPTNILSFPGYENFSGILLLSKETYSRECRLYGQPGKKHLLRLLAHGLAHIAGLDHGKEMDAIVAQLENATCQLQTEDSL